MSETLQNEPSVPAMTQDILTFTPLLRRIRWGGRKLGTVLGKAIGSEHDFAESWEIADQPGFESVVNAGENAGSTLSDILAENAESLMGTADNSSPFPLLFKFLDANDWLSLQVHPNDEQAATFAASECGKTEAWVILDAQPESTICAGLQKGVTSHDLLKHLESGTVEQVLHMIPARKGDCIFVPAGTVHALGPGIVLAEIQQQSNLTFRLHDWGRLDTDGNPRDLHIAEAISCIDFDRGPVTPVTPVQLSDGDHHFEELVRCEHFVVRRHISVDDFSLKADHRFRILVVLDGESEVSTDNSRHVLAKGETALVCASADAIAVRPSQRSTILEILRP